MDNVKKDNNQELMQWDPFRAMREMMPWDPFREIAPMFPRFARAFSPREWMPAFEVRENKDSYVFKADLPGIKQDDLEVSLTGNRLVISGKREHEKETRYDTFFTYEREYGSFTRAFTLPDSADFEHVKTELEAGVLTVVVPKKPEMQAKKIPIAVGTSKS